MHLSKILDIFGSMLTGLQLSLEFLSPFLNTGVMVAFFNMDGKLDFSIESLKFETKTLADISAFSLPIFVGISVSQQALEVSNFKMSPRISSLCVFDKEKGSLRFLLQTSPIASMLGWFLNFNLHFKTRCLILLAKGSRLEYPSILRLLTILEKKVFNTSTKYFCRHP